MARIAIVLATYNGARYLPQMLDSLVSQERRADIVFAIDDGSSDSTPEILRNYASKLPICLEALPHNTGHRAAFSAALEIARKELSPDDLIALADQDDIWLPQKLRLLENAIENSPKNILSAKDLRDTDLQCNIFVKSIMQYRRKCYVE